MRQDKSSSTVLDEHHLILSISNIDEVKAERHFLSRVENQKLGS